MLQLLFSVDEEDSSGHEDPALQFANVRNTIIVIIIISLHTNI
mgnify:CR=1 FL=1